LLLAALLAAYIQIARRERDRSSKVEAFDNEPPVAVCIPTELLEPSTTQMFVNRLSVRHRNAWRSGRDASV